MSQTVYFAVKKENLNQGAAKDLHKHLLKEEVIIDNTGVNYNLYGIDIETTLDLESDEVSVEDVEKEEAKKAAYTRSEMTKYEAKELSYDEVAEIARKQKELREQQVNANLTEDEIFVKNKTQQFKNDFGFRPNQFGFLTTLRKVILKEDFIDIQTLVDLSKDKLYDTFDGSEIELLLDFAQKTQQQIIDKKVAKKPGMKV
jgi:hypothetical protein